MERKGIARIWRATGRESARAGVRREGVIMILTNLLVGLWEEKKKRRREGSLQLCEKYICGGGWPLHLCRQARGWPEIELTWSSGHCQLTMSFPTPFFIYYLLFELLVSIMNLTICVSDYPLYSSIPTISRDSFAHCNIYSHGHKSAPHIINSNIYHNEIDIID